MTAYEEGREAYAKGSSFHSNPYAGSGLTEKSLDWDRGWDDAETAAVHSAVREYRSSSSR